MDKEKRAKKIKKKSTATTIVDDSSDEYATDNQLDDEDYRLDEEAEDFSESEKSQTGESSNKATVRTGTRMKAADTENLLKICIKEYDNIRITTTTSVTDYPKQMVETQNAWLRIQSEFQKNFGVSKHFFSMNA